MSVTLSVSPCPAIPSTCTSTRAPAAGRGEALVGQLGKLRPIGNRPGGLPHERGAHAASMRELPVVAKSDEKSARQKMKLRIPHGSGFTHLILSPTGRILIIVFSL